MSISLDEDLLSVADAAKALPAHRGGKRVHTSCVYRWALYGVYGVRLETIQVGGTLCTSKQALERFFAALARARRGGPPEVATRPAASTRRAREVAEASRLAEEALK
jgi:hypothetical protein